MHITGPHSGSIYCSHCACALYGYAPECTTHCVMVAQMLAVHMYYMSSGQPWSNTCPACCVGQSLWSPRLVGPTTWPDHQEQVRLLRTSEVQPPARGTSLFHVLHVTDHHTKCFDVGMLVRSVDVWLSLWMYCCATSTAWQCMPWTVSSCATSVATHTHSMQCGQQHC